MILKDLKMIKTINNVLIDSEEIQVFDKRLTVCPVCGKEFLPNDLGSYCYKQINNFKRVMKLKVFTQNKQKLSCNLAKTLL